MDDSNPSSRRTSFSERFTQNIPSPGMGTVGILGYTPGSPCEGFGQWTKSTVVNAERSLYELSQLPEYANSPILSVLSVIVGGLNAVTKALKEDIVHIEEKRQKDKEVYQKQITEITEQIQEIQVQMAEPEYLSHGAALRVLIYEARSAIGTCFRRIWGLELYPDIFAIYRGQEKRTLDFRKFSRHVEAHYKLAFKEDAPITKFYASQGYGRKQKDWGEETTLSEGQVALAFDLERVSVELQQIPALAGETDENTKRWAAEEFAAYRETYEKFIPKVEEAHFAARSKYIDETEALTELFMTSFDDTRFSNLTAEERKNVLRAVRAKCIDARELLKDPQMRNLLYYRDPADKTAEDVPDDPSDSRDTRAIKLRRFLQAHSVPFFGDNSPSLVADARQWARDLRPKPRPYFEALTRVRTPQHLPTVSHASSVRRPTGVYSLSTRLPDTTHLPPPSGAAAPPTSAPQITPSSSESRTASWVASSFGEVPAAPSSDARVSFTHAPRPSGAPGVSFAGIVKRAREIAQVPIPEAPPVPRAITPESSMGFTQTTTGTTLDPFIVDIMLDMFISKLTEKEKKYEAAKVTYETIGRGLAILLDDVLFCLAIDRHGEAHTMVNNIVHGGGMSDDLLKKSVEAAPKYNLNDILEGLRRLYDTLFEGDRIDADMSFETIIAFNVFAREEEKTKLLASQQQQPSNMSSRGRATGGPQSLSTAPEGTV